MSTHDAARINVAKNVVSNTFLDGEAAANPPIEALRDRYAFIGRTMKSVPGHDDPELIDAALKQYHQFREETASATFTAEDLPGWRLMILKRFRNEEFAVGFAGVRDNGVMEQGVIASASGMDARKAPARAVATRLANLFKNSPGQMPRPEPEVEWTAEPGRTYREPAVDGAPEGHMKILRADWLSLSAHSKTTHDEARHAAGYEASALAAMIAKVKSGVPAQEIEPGFDTEKVGNPLLYNRLEVAMRKSQHRKLGAMSVNAMRALDTEVSSVLYSVNETTAQGAHWLMGRTGSEENGWQFDPEVARNRRQAIAAFPLMARSFFENDGKLEEVHEAIDTGGSLPAAMSKAFDVSPAAVRRVTGLTWQMAGRYAHIRPRQLFEYLGAMDLNHVPSTRKGHADMHAALAAAKIVAMHVGDSQKNLIASVGGRFSAHAKLLEGNPPQGVYDLKNEIERRVLAPALAQRARADGKSEEDALSFGRAFGQHEQYHTLDEGLKRNGVLKGHSLRSALVASERWHRAIPRINNALGDGSQFGNPRYNNWDPLVGQIELPGGLTAVELHSTASLKEEGLRQSHCVGGYAPEVRRGDSLIFSLRSGDEVASTVEVSIRHSKDGKYELEVVQNMGFDNDEPSREAVQAGKALRKELSSVDSDRMNSYLGALDEVVRVNSNNEVHQAAGYDALDRKGLEKAYETLKEYLPKGCAKMTVDQYVDKILDHPENEKNRRPGQEMNLRTTGIKDILGDRAA